MSLLEQVHVATGVDPTLVAVALFMALSFVVWALRSLLEHR